MKLLLYYGNSCAAIHNIYLRKQWLWKGDTEHLDDMYKYNIYIYIYINDAIANLLLSNFVCNGMPYLETAIKISVSSYKKLIMCALYIR